MTGPSGPGSVVVDRSGRRQPRALAPLRHRAYRRLAAALVLSTFASGVWVVAMVWEVIRIGGGPGELSVVSTASAVGVLSLALFGGVVADRVPPKRILLCVAAVEVAGISLVTALSLADATRLWHLAAVALVTGAGMAFYYPAYTAWLPSLVPPSDLMAVNGIEGVVRPTIGQALGPGLAGFVVGVASSGAAAGVAAAAASAGLLALASVPFTPGAHEPETRTGRARVGAVFVDLREGVAYLVRTPWLLATLLFASVMVLAVMGPLQVLIPFLVRDRLGGGPSHHAAVTAAFGIGGAAGSFVMGSLRMPRRYLTVMNLTWGVGCLPLLVIGLASNVGTVVVAAFVLGAMFSAPMVIWGTLLQRRVPPHLLGRVASLDFFVSLSLMPVSMAVVGPVSDLIGVRNTFALAGLVPIVAAVVATIAARLPADELAHPLVDDDD